MKISLSCRFWCCALLLASTFTGNLPAQTVAGAEDRFEAQVLAYEAADRTGTPLVGAILLAGDSQFFRWKTVAEDLPGYSIINRGIDSFQLQELLRDFDRLVLLYNPEYCADRNRGQNFSHAKN